MEQREPGGADLTESPTRWRSHVAPRVSVRVVALLTLVALGMVAGCSPSGALGAANAAHDPDRPANLVGTPSDSPSPDGAQPETPLATAPPGQTLAVGDSVMMGARSCLERRDVRVNAVGSRQPTALLAWLRDHRHRLPATVIVHTGTNGGVTSSEIRQIMKVVGDQRLVVWMTLQLRNDYSVYTFENRSNAAIRAAAARYPNARLADWNVASEPHRSSWLYGDGIHLTPRGCRAFARLAVGTARS